MANGVVVSDMLITVKSREVQRAMLAEMRGEAATAQKHFLAAAHLEQVLADDYREAGDLELCRRSLISAASCFWRAAELARAKHLFDELQKGDPSRSAEIDQVIDDLQQQCAAQ